MKRNTIKVTVVIWPAGWGERDCYHRNEPGPLRLRPELKVMLDFFKTPPSVCWPTARIDSCASHHLLCAMKGSVVAAAAVPQTVDFGAPMPYLDAFSIKLPRSLYLISAMHAIPNHWMKLPLHWINVELIMHDGPAANRQLECPLICIPSLDGRLSSRVWAVLCSVCFKNICPLVGKPGSINNYNSACPKQRSRSVLNIYHFFRHLPRDADATDCYRWFRIGCCR